MASKKKDPTTKSIVLPAILWLSAIAVGGFFLFGPSLRPESVPKKPEFETHIAAEDSQWKERQALLLELTQQYVDTAEEPLAGAAKGLRLAPKEYLNEQLKARDEDWRVREVHGMDAEVFDVFGGRRVSQDQPRSE